MNKYLSRSYRVAITCVHIGLLLVTSCVAAHENESLIKGLQSLVGDNLVLRNRSAIQTFHISDLEKTDTVYIYWPENRMLMKLRDYDASHERWSRLILTAEFVDLETDVVADTSKIGSSTYLETASEISRQIGLATKGTVVTIITDGNSVADVFM